MPSGTNKKLAVHTEKNESKDSL